MRKIFVFAIVAMLLFVFQPISVDANGWTQTHGVTNFTIPAGGHAVGSFNFPLQPWDDVQFNFPTSAVRVGMTNNGLLSGARWATSGNARLIIPSTGQWRFIIQNTTNIPMTITGTYTVNSANAMRVIVPEIVSNSAEYNSYPYNTEEKEVLLLQETLLTAGRTEEVFDVDFTLYQPGYILEDNLVLQLVTD